MPIRHAAAEWNGTLKQGKGTMRTGSGACAGEYSFASRFEEGAGTNPDELIGAAHAGCFSMALSGLIEQAGYRPDRIATRAKVHIEKKGEGFRISRIDLETEARVPEMDEKTFLAQAEAAKNGCPVSQALTGTDISLRARLIT